MSPSRTNRPVRGAFRAALFGLGLELSACGGRTNELSATSSHDSGGPKGGAVPSCTDNGTVHANGTNWPCSGTVVAAPACNTCWCLDGQISNTLIRCPFGAPDAGADVDAGPSEPPSCAPGGPGMTNCGPGRTGAESCCMSLEVTGGTYFRSYTSDADGGPAGEADPATVSSFNLDKYLVTVGRFRQFVNAWSDGAGYPPPAGSGKHTHLNSGQGLVDVGAPPDAGTVYEPGWVATDDSNISPTNTNLATCSPYSTWTGSTGSQENLPITCVNWYEAYAFCIWDGGFLPSEAEWEYAAAGGSQQREYPWGSTDPGTANQYAIYAGAPPGSCYYPGMTVCNIAPVGTAMLGAGLWGQLDLAGDVFEWNIDWYAAYAACTDCADLTAASARVLRGGDFDNGDGASDLLPPYRNYGTPTARSGSLGFRCSRSP